MGFRRNEAGNLSVSLVTTVDRRLRGKLEVGIIEAEVDRVPTADDERPTATYRSWNPEDTKIVTYRYGAIGELYKHGKMVLNKAEAVKDVKENHGEVLEANHTPGRSFFRVHKVKR